jgi:hypothetical protein
VHEVLTGIEFMYFTLPMQFLKRINDVPHQHDEMLLLQFLLSPHQRVQRAGLHELQDYHELVLLLENLEHLDHSWMPDQFQHLDLIVHHLLKKKRNAHNIWSSTRNFSLC